jgi:hypothetical protein
MSIGLREPSTCTSQAEAPVAGRRASPAHIAARVPAPRRPLLALAGALGGFAAGLLVGRRSVLGRAVRRVRRSAAHRRGPPGLDFLALRLAGHDGRSRLSQAQVEALLWGAVTTLGEACLEAVHEVRRGQPTGPLPRSPSSLCGPRCPAAPPALPQRAAPHPRRPPVREAPALVLASASKHTPLAPSLSSPLPQCLLALPPSLRPPGVVLSLRDLPLLLDACDQDVSLNDLLGPRKAALTLLYRRMGKHSYKCYAHLAPPLVLNRRGGKGDGSLHAYVRPASAAAEALLLAASSVAAVRAGGGSDGGGECAHLLDLSPEAHEAAFAGHPACAECWRSGRFSRLAAAQALAGGQPVAACLTAALAVEGRARAVVEAQRAVVQRLVEDVPAVQPPTLLLPPAHGTHASQAA